MPTYGIATLLENYPTGYEFAEDNIPLHITHVDSVTLDIDSSTLEAKLKDAVSSFPSFTTKATKNVLYGISKDTPVTEVELNEPLLELHRLIMQLLVDVDGLLKNPDFHNDGFMPHVSVYGTRKVNPGEDIHINDLVIGTKISDDENPIHKILATIPLQ